MGGGSTKPLPPEALRRDWSTVPVTFADLQTNGKEEHRIDEHAARHRGSITTDYGRISPTRQIFTSNSQLEVQAAAHWHRIISHAKDQRNDHVSEMLGELMEKPKCPECARGNPSGPICRICGRDASADLAAAAAAAAAGVDAPSSSSAAASTLVPRVDWNPVTKSYDRHLVDRLLQADNISDDDGSAQTLSPDHASGSSSAGSPYKEGGMYAKVDFTDEDTHMQHILEILLDTEGLRRSKNRKAYTEKVAAKVRASPESEESKGRQAPVPVVPPSPLAALRKGRRRKFVGMGLDSDSEGEGEGDEKDDNQARSRFADQYESDLDLEEVGVAPYPPLPPVEVELRKRTSTSITVAWDSSQDALESLQAVLMAYGKDKLPIYQLQYRLHAPNQNPLFAAAAGGGAGGAGGESKSSAVGEDPNEGWTVGSKRTKEAGATIEGLAANTPYALRCLRKGWGDWGPTVVIRSGPGAPSAPRALVATEVTSTSVLVTWHAPERDNGLPVSEYLVRMKPYQGSFECVFRGRERCFQTTDLTCNTVHIFEVQAANKAGSGEYSERLAVRTLPHGAAPMTPWVEAVDDKTHKLYYTHPKSNAVAWTLPKGALVDSVASFRSKRNYLLRRFERTMADVCKATGVLQRVMQVQASRSNLLEDSLRRLYSAETDELSGGLLRVHFRGEDGLDAGGLAKDWFGEMARRLHDGSAGLLRLSEAGLVTIDPRAAALHRPTESKWMFKAVGIFLAKAIFDSQTLGITLDPLLVLLLCGREPSIDDLEESEPAFFKGLHWVLDNDVSEADLTFTCSYELFGESKVVELVPQGINKSVDEDNKGEYVGHMQRWLCRGRYEPAVGHLLQGFHELVGESALQHFAVPEVQLLLSGRPNIDCSEVRRDVVLAGFDEQSPQVAWLWECLEDFSQEMLCRFVGFFSGCSCVPYDGLNPPLMVTKAEDAGDAALPRAHTCFNQLVLPRYSSKTILSERLQYALDNQAGGFFMA